MLNRVRNFGANVVDNPWVWFGMTVANFMNTAYQMMANPSWFIFVVGALGTVCSFILTIRTNAAMNKVDPA